MGMDALLLLAAKVAASACMCMLIGLERAWAHKEAGVRSFAIAYHTTPERVFKLYATLGDLGLVAEQLSKEAGRVSNVLQVDDVFEGLKTIAQTSGKGTVEKRIALLADLLRQVDSVSTKYVVRIVVENLRLGIGDSTILDALASAKFHDTHKRTVLEGAYNKTSDLGLIARTFSCLKYYTKTECRSLRNRWLNA